MTTCATCSPNSRSSTASPSFAAEEDLAPRFAAKTAETRQGRVLAPSKPRENVVNDAIQTIGCFRLGQPRGLRQSLCDFLLFHAAHVIAGDLAVTPLRSRADSRHPKRAKGVTFRKKYLE